MTEYVMVRTSKIFFLASLAGPLPFSQFETSEVLGTVRDPSQAAVPKAAVTLTNQGTGAEAKTTTDENGSYGFFDVKIGTYTVTVEIQGFAKFTAPDVVVNVGARQRVDVRKQVGAVTESITVT